MPHDCRKILIALKTHFAAQSVKWPVGSYGLFGFADHINDKGKARFLYFARNLPAAGSWNDYAQDDGRTVQNRRHNRYGESQRGLQSTK